MHTCPNTTVRIVFCVAAKENDGDTNRAMQYPGIRGKKTFILRCLFDCDSVKPNHDLYFTTVIPYCLPPSHTEARMLISWLFNKRMHTHTQLLHRWKKKKEKSFTSRVLLQLSLQILIMSKLITQITWRGISSGKLLYKLAAYRILLLQVKKHSIK